MQVRFFKVETLPATLEPNALYYVINNDYVETYLSDNNGNAKSAGNSTMINNLINEALSGWGGGVPNGSTVEFASNIAERDLLATNATTNLMVVVIDASDDPTVDSGSALYGYDLSNETWYKLSEYESMDVVVNWSKIQGRPISTAAQIDSAVSASHSHSNKSVLDKLSESAQNNLLYNGEPIKPQWTQADW